MASECFIPEMSEHSPVVQLLTQLELYFSVRHVNKSMRTFGQLFDDDYDKVAIFLTVAEACLQAIFHLVALDPEQVDIEKLYSDINEVGMTALSIGEQTRIPRETVRRKLKALIDEGFLAVAATSKNIYLPAETLRSERMSELFKWHIKDVGQLIRSVSYYQRPMA